MNEVKEDDAIETPMAIFVEGPDGVERYMPKIWKDVAVSPKYGVTFRRVVVETKTGIESYRAAESYLADFDSYAVAFDAGVLQIFGADGSLLHAYAPGHWLGIQTDPAVRLIGK